MAAFAAGIVSAVASALPGAASAGAAAGAAGGGLLSSIGGVAGAASMAGTVIQGGLTVASALSQMRAGERAAAAQTLTGVGSIRSSNFLARAELLQAQGGAIAARMASQAEAVRLRIDADDIATDIGLEKVAGLERRNDLRRSLIQTIGERDVATAAAGVDLSFGTPAIARGEAIADTERALGIDEATEKFRISRLKQRASTLRTQAGIVRRGGLLKAAQISAGGKLAAAGITSGAASAASAAFQSADTLRDQGKTSGLLTLASGALDILRRG